MYSFFALPVVSLVVERLYACRELLVERRLACRELLVERRLACRELSGRTTPFLFTPKSALRNPQSFRPSPKLSRFF